MPFPWLLQLWFDGLLFCPIHPNHKTLLKPESDRENDRNQKPLDRSDDRQR
jgi:uncharacterized Zn finger protein (UPF0148 family)